MGELEREPRSRRLRRISSSLSKRTRQSGVEGFVGRLYALRRHASSVADRVHRSSRLCLRREVSNVLPAAQLWRSGNCRSFSSARTTNTVRSAALPRSQLAGMGTSSARSSSNTRYFTRGDVIPGLQVNAMDVLAVHKAIQFSKQYTAEGKGPLVLEMVTYRCVPASSCALTRADTAATR